MDAESLSHLTSSQLLTELERTVKLAREVSRYFPLDNLPAGIRGIDYPLMSIGDFDIWPREYQR
jgi:hypothetical protein